MKNKDFDNIDKLARDAFGNFEAPLGSGDWMNFQQQLDNESSIDQVAKEALGGYKVPIDPTSWDDFQQLRQQKEKGLLYIWWYKAAEIGALALFLLGTLFYLPYSQKETSNTTLAYGSTPTLNSVSSTNSAIIPTNTSKEIVSKATLTLSDATTPATIAGALLTNINGAPNKEKPLLSKTIANAVSATTVNSPTSVKTSTTSSTPAITVTSVTRKVAATTVLVEDSAELIGATDEEHVERVFSSLEPSMPLNDIVHNTTEVKNNSTHFTQIFAINSKGLQLTPADQSSLNIEPIKQIGSTGLKAPHICRHYLGAVLGVGANMHTSMGETSIGYSGGLVYEKEFSGKIAISAGLNVSFKHYDRTDNITLTRSQVDGQIYQIVQEKTSNLILVEIPLDIHYTCFRNDKWRIYASAGLTANAIFSRTYTGSQEVQVNRLTINTALNSNDFERGLVEGGEAQQNFHISLGGGIGVERKLSENLSLYLTPTYRHSANTVHGDLIHTFNVNIGIKKAL